MKPRKSWSGWTNERNQRCHVTGLALTSTSKICKRMERYHWGGRGKECEHIAEDCFPFDFRILSLIFEKESHITTCYWPKEIIWFKLDIPHPVQLRWDKFRSHKCCWKASSQGSRERVFPTKHGDAELKLAPQLLCSFRYSARKDVYWCVVDCFSNSLCRRTWMPCAVNGGG